VNLLLPTRACPRWLVPLADARPAQPRTARLGWCGARASVAGGPWASVTSGGRRRPIAREPAVFARPAIPSRTSAAQTEIGAWVAGGKIKYGTHIVKGLEHAPDALNLLFTGGNTGKVIVEIE
jgi:hypothetical protein